MNKETMLMEIRRAAAENGNGPLGIGRFEELTGISASAWLGRHWTKWSEATAEAGIRSGRMNEAFDNDFLLTILAELTRSCRRFPSKAETQIARARDSSIPNHKVFDRFGTKAARVEALRQFASDRAGFADLPALLPAPDTEAGVAEPTVSASTELGDGFVYMMKLGKAYKVGRTFSVPRRHREITLELPQKPDVVHSIRTDDPDGIEAYWHRRFEKTRTNGEWFALDAADVKAFKRRKFM